MFKNKFINFKPIILGGIIWILLFFLLLLLSYVFRQINFSIPNPPILILFIFLISGVVVGYASGEKYVTSISNAAFIGFLFAAIIGLTSNVQYIWIIGAIIDGTVLSAIGGLIGAFIYKRVLG